MFLSTLDPNLAVETIFMSYVFILVRNIKSEDTVLVYVKITWVRVLSETNGNFGEGHKSEWLGDKTNGLQREVCSMIYAPHHVMP